MIPSEEVCQYLNRVKDSEPWKELYSLIDEANQESIYDRNVGRHSDICKLISDIKREAVWGKDNLMYEAASHISHIVVALYNGTE
tara:strand:- start:496 stop:750 length:255 start_codon:yes stop_codon:yes gene_type:complete